MSICEMNGNANDPLKRIQDEINEVARREREYRKKLQQQQRTLKNLDDDFRSETPSSLTSSVHSGESLEENNNSDDSGILSSISPINDSISINEKDKYIRPKYYNSVSMISPTSAVSTPNLLISPTSPRVFKPISNGQKSLMQKFIASRGKLNLNNNGISNHNNNNNNNNNNSLSTITANTIELKTPAIQAVNMIMLPAMVPLVVERDTNGRPIRRGFVPVEEKIQKELNDLKTREIELKRFRKLTNSTPDLLDAIENEFLDMSEDEDNDNVEHCLGPKTYSCDMLDKKRSMQNSPDYIPQPSGGMRPAVSLALLCDLDPEKESLSSQNLIAKFESLIQKHA